MGAYLSAPSVEKKSDDFSDSDKFSFGVSRMQGWRISMEDAHNCVPSLESNSSLFGVYDGHGGSEVALYCALHFSDVLRELPSYKEGKYEDALKETFMSLDKVLLDPETVRELKVLADRDPDSGPPTKADIQAAEAREEEEECEEDEMKLLHEEATMSIEELLERYGKAANETKATIDAQRAKLKEEKLREEGGSSSSFEAVSSSSASDGDSGVGSSSTIDLKDEKTDLVTDAQDSSVSSSSDAKADYSGSQPSSSVSSSTVDKTASSSSALTRDSEGCTTSASNTTPSDSSEIVDSKKDSEDNDVEDNAKVMKSTTSGKFQPKLRSVKLKLITPPKDDEIAGDSDSESGEDGFDSDEAVEGSSDSEEDEDDDEEEESEEEDEDDIDISEIPTVAPVSTTIEEPGKDSGTTAVVALLNGYELLVANAGDSRCVLCRNGVAVDMSEDHKPEDESEIKRIKAAGGHVNMQGRVNGGLNLSRAIGDHCYKTNKTIDLESQMISAMPDIKKVILEPGDDFMVLACDGIWNVFSSQEVIDFVRGRLPPPTDTKENCKLSSICEELLDACLAPDTTGDGTGCDNMTCIIVRFNTSWLMKSSSAGSGDAKDMDIKTQKLDEHNSTSLRNDVDHPGAETDCMNVKVNGENSKTVQENSITGCKRPRTENDVPDSTEDTVDIVEQSTKKQKVA